VITCHLPCTFQLRTSFDAFCQALGLEVLGPCEGSHITLCRRSQMLKPDGPRLREMERRSQHWFPLVRVASPAHQPLEPSGPDSPIQPSSLLPQAAERR